MRKDERVFKHFIMMIMLIIFFGMACSYVTFAQPGEHSVYNAINADLISAEFTSTGAASGHIADLTITSNYGEPITIDLANSGLEGMVLANSAEDEQDEVITDTPGTSEGPGSTTYTPTGNVTIGPGESVTIPVIGYCINYDLSNPTDGTMFGLNDTSTKTDIGELSAVLETIATYSFPEDFTSDDTYDVTQISFWAAQSDNSDVTLEDYATRGYDLDDSDVSVVSDILNTSGIDTTNIVALSGKQKDEDTTPDESTTADEFPWVYVVIPIVGIAIAVGIYFLRSKPSKPGLTEEHVTPLSEPAIEVSESGDATQAQATKCKYSCEQACTATCNLKCEASCIARCERGTTTYDRKRGGGVDCKYACMKSCTMKCTSWRQ